ncbi:MAG: SEC-C metal-binding domain-containing protein [Candidatus Binatia bacterium]
MINDKNRAGRNELCPCGSGKKYKRCCGAVDTAAEDPASRFFGVAAVLAGLMLVGGGFVFAQAFFFDDVATGKKVWSAEHGHYHDVGGDTGSAEGGPGKVWNEEHGHFHDAAKPEPPTGADTPVAGALQGLRAAELDAAREKAAPSAPE